MTIGEFRRELEKYDDNLPVMVSDVLKNGLKDAFIHGMVNTESYELEGVWIGPEWIFR